MSITGVMPQHAMATVVADFFYQHVILHPSLREMQSRKVQFEIEAKMGTLIHKETGQRVRLPVMSECVLDDQAREINFQSNMTEVCLSHCSLSTFCSLANAALTPRIGLPQVFQFLS